MDTILSSDNFMSSLQNILKILNHSIEENPFMLEEQFIRVVEELAEQIKEAGQVEIAEIICERLNDLRQVRADPVIRTLFEFVRTDRHDEALALERFLDVNSDHELRVLLLQNPFMLEEQFIRVVEEIAKQFEAQEEEVNAEAVRQRLNLLQQMRAEPAMRALLEFVRAGSDDKARALQQFLAVNSLHELIELVERVPFALEEEFISVVEELAEQTKAAGETELAEVMRKKLKKFVEIKLGKEMVPIINAVADFAFASSDDEARAIFEAQRDLLMPYKAQQTIEGFTSSNPDTQQRFKARKALLSELRRAEQPSPILAPQAAPPVTSASGATQTTTFDMRHAQVRRLTQVAGNQYDRSAHAQTGGTASVINETNIYQVPLQPRWVRPAAPRLGMEVVTRDAELKAVGKKLLQRGRAAITSNSMAVQGMAGVGKTVLANLFALDLSNYYKGGVLWQPIGVDIRQASQVNPILNRWASYGFGLQQKENYYFTPAAVRAILSGQGRLLVVLDDVWRLSAVQPLIEALPSDAHLLITTRSQQVANQLRGAVHNLDLLTEQEALRLIWLRLKERQLNAEDRPWMVALAESVGRHALALDIAVGSLKLLGADEWAAAAEQIASDIREGAGFGELPLSDEERSSVVEKTLKSSYDALSPVGQRRFRWLGAMAAEAEFFTDMVAALWNCPATEARKQLNLFVSLALLTRLEERGQPTRWRQHSLLRAYALALLRTEREYEPAAAHYTKIYLDAMRQADDEQRFYQMLPAIPHLRHAFEWAIENNLQQAQNLIANTTNLHAGFGMVREHVKWSTRALEIARQRGNEANIAQALL